MKMETSARAWVARLTIETEKGKENKKREEPEMTEYKKKGKINDIT